MFELFLVSGARLRRAPETKKASSESRKKLQIKIKYSFSM
jgi:hypothetical protein